MIRIQQEGGELPKDRKKGMRSLLTRLAQLELNQSLSYTQEKERDQLWIEVLDYRNRVTLIQSNNQEASKTSVK